MGIFRLVGTHREREFQSGKYREKAVLVHEIQEEYAFDKHMNSHMRVT